MLTRRPARSLLRWLLDLLPAVWGLLLIRPLLVFGWLEEPFQVFVRGAVLSYPFACLAWLHLRLPPYLRWVGNHQHRADIRLSLLHPGEYLASRLAPPAARLLLPLILLGPLLAWLLHVATPHTLNGKPLTLTHVVIPAIFLLCSAELYLALRLMALAFVRPQTTMMINSGMAGVWLVGAVLGAADFWEANGDPFSWSAPLFVSAFVVTTGWTLAELQGRWHRLVAGFSIVEDAPAPVRTEASTRRRSKLRRLAFSPAAIRTLVLLPAALLFAHSFTIPLDPDYETLLRLSRRNGRHDSVLIHAVRSDPGNPALWEEIAIYVHEDFGAMSERDCLERAAAMIPDSQYPWRLNRILMEGCYFWEDWFAAVKLADRIVLGFEKVPWYLRTSARDSLLANQYYERGYCLAMTGDADAAGRDLEKARALHPNAANYHEVRAHCLAVSGDLDGAVRSATISITAIREAPDEDAELYDRLLADYSLSDWISQPDLARIHKVRARYHFYLGRYPEAYTDFEEAIRLDESENSVRSWLRGAYQLERGLCLLKAGRADEARAVWAEEEDRYFGRPDAGFALVKINEEKWHEAWEILDPKPPILDRYPHVLSSLLSAITTEKLGLSDEAEPAWAEWDESTRRYPLYVRMASVLLPENCRDVFDAHETAPPRSFVGPLRPAGR